MSTRPRVVDEEAQAGGAVFEVDTHGVQSEHPDEQPTDQVVDDTTPPVIMGWTPEEATALVCSLWNLGILLYGPEWAADPRETIGWNITVAQLLDVYVPKGTGGMVQLGAGMLMIGNGVVMMAARRAPLIRRGPRPLWVRQPKDETEEVAAPAPPPSPPARRDNGTYQMPRDLTPKPTPDLNLG